MSVCGVLLNYLDEYVYTNKTFWKSFLRDQDTVYFMSKYGYLDYQSCELWRIKNFTAFKSQRETEKDVGISLVVAKC